VAKKYIVYISLSIVFISIAAIVGLFLYFKYPFETKATENLSADDLVEQSIETAEITTNLADEGFVRVKFRIQLNNEKAKEELEKRIFQLENAVIYELAGTTKQALQGQEGIVSLETNVADRVNEFLDDGEVVRVYTTQKIIQ
jgi:flagellar FliL protein